MEALHCPTSGCDDDSSTTIVHVLILTLGAESPVRSGRRQVYFSWSMVVMVTASLAEYDSPKSAAGKTLSLTPSSLSPPLSTPGCETAA